jgi:hypothetical protein
VQRAEELAQAVISGHRKGCIGNVNHLTMETDQGKNLREIVFRSSSPITQVDAYYSD